MTRYLILCLIGFCISPTTITAQCTSKAQKLYTQARQKQVDQPQKSLELLSKALKLCPRDEKIIFLLADLYAQAGEMGSVIEVLQRYTQSNDQIDPRAWYFMAEAERAIFQFDEAIQHYQAYLDARHNNRTLNLNAANNIAHAQFAQSAYASQDSVTFHPLSQHINTSSPEYLMILDATEELMIFTRRENLREEAYFCTKDADGTWSMAQRITDLPVNFRKAAFTMSADGSMIVFAMADDPRGYGGFDLYILEKKGDHWTGPKNMGPLVNSNGWESQPSISADGQTIYFSSDRKGGEGGNDLWKTRRGLSDTWEAPTNLGDDINSPGNEESPFIHRDQRTLYFRSDGHPGLGSFDLFMSEKIRFQTWTKPVNLGYPINSIGNDGSLYVSMTGELAYIATDVDKVHSQDYRHQKILDNTDLYEFRLDPKYRPTPTSYERYHFVDALSGAALEPQVLLQELESTDTFYLGRAPQESPLILCLPSRGLFGISAELEGYLPYYASYRPDASEDIAAPTLHTIPMYPIPRAMDPGQPPHAVILSNVTFETNEAVLNPTSYPALIQLKTFLDENPSVKIKIRGHTDDIGSEEDNLELSGRRAHAVYDYLIEQGIASERLAFEGYGESMPITNNDSEESRQQNRRTDFIIIE